MLAPTAEDGCVAYFLSSLNPAGEPNARLVRLDGDGKILWDLVFTGGGAPNSPYVNDGLESLTEEELTRLERPWWEFWR